MVRSGVTLTESWGGDGFQLFPPSPPFSVSGALLACSLSCSPVACLGDGRRAFGVVTAVCLVRHWMSARGRVRPPVPAGSGGRQS